MRMSASGRPGSSIAITTSLQPVPDSPADADRAVKRAEIVSFQECSIFWLYVSSAPEPLRT